MARYNRGVSDDLIRLLVLIFCVKLMASQPAASNSNLSQQFKPDADLHDAPPLSHTAGQGQGDVQQCHNDTKPNGSSLGECPTLDIPVLDGGATASNALDTVNAVDSNHTAERERRIQRRQQWWRERTDEAARQVPERETNGAAAVQEEEGVEEKGEGKEGGYQSTKSDWERREMERRKREEKEQELEMRRRENEKKEQAEREERIRTADRKLQERQQEMEMQEMHMKRREKEFDQRKRDMKYRERELRHREREMRHREREIRQREREMENREREMIHRERQAEMERERERLREFHGLPPMMEELEALGTGVQEEGQEGGDGAADQAMPQATYHSPQGHQALAAGHTQLETEEDAEQNNIASTASAFFQENHAAMLGVHLQETDHELMPPDPTQDLFGCPDYNVHPTGGSGWHLGLNVREGCRFEFQDGGIEGECINLTMARRMRAAQRQGQRPWNIQPEEDAVQFVDLGQARTHRHIMRAVSWQLVLLRLLGVMCVLAAFKSSAFQFPVPPLCHNVCPMNLRHRQILLFLLAWVCYFLFA